MVYVRPIVIFDSNKIFPSQQSLAFNIFHVSSVNLNLVNNFVNAYLKSPSNIYKLPKVSKYLFHLFKP